ncbi:hypothetical protein P152DRAFT_443465 [Eremomyces bilateralis CBS 781.70]|uniref:Phospholipid/glycerol acyltransferase domain-containing protein n=1 Tax=Eremomyces bilateralis CBS 781.70 TaxID=1392243 RepID=A0A6G1FS53_9PEZI|nr:uncharacterized protein P152DRAFT_443465 [Eremomyces bilateralis CBS 781.70]KAF1808607.1 hypothetical protein P152DRAFT_443465 [Eremomyces bilateralis CBS 781.70]
MEKFSQYRDRGSGIAPFFPVTTSTAALALPLHIFLFTIRIPLLLTVALSYYLFFGWLPIRSLGKKAALWLILGIPGIWWVDLQIDGVKRGSLAKQHLSRLPHPGTIIASSFTSPIDSLYLAAIFDPIFTVSYPNTPLVRPVSLLSSILRAFLSPRLLPSDKDAAALMTLAQLRAKHPDRIIVVLPECTTSNGRGILALSPSLTTAPAGTKVFPVSLRYTPPDITSPLPGIRSGIAWLWRLCSRPTHCIRVRIGAAIDPADMRAAVSPRGLSSSWVDVAEETSPARRSSAQAKPMKGDRLLVGQSGLSKDQERFLERVGEDLARLGRVKRVGLGAKEKVDFLRLWEKRGR